MAMQYPHISVLIIDTILMMRELIFISSHLKPQNKFNDEPRSQI